MIQLTANELKTKIENKETFLIDLFATWCQPCKIMIKNLEMVESELVNDKGVNVYKYDVESDMELSVKLGVRSVPTVKIFKEGNEVFSKTGVMSPDQIKMSVSQI